MWQILTLDKETEIFIPSGGATFTVQEGMSTARETSFMLKQVILLSFLQEVSSQRCEGLRICHELLEVPSWATPNHEWQGLEIGPKTDVMLAFCGNFEVVLHGDFVCSGRLHVAWEAFGIWVFWGGVFTIGTSMSYSCSADTCESADN